MVRMFSCLTPHCCQGARWKGTKTAFFSRRHARAKPGLPPFLQILQGRQQKVSGEAASQGGWGSHVVQSGCERPDQQSPRLGKHALLKRTGKWVPGIQAQSRRLRKQTPEEPGLRCV